MENELLQPIEIHVIFANLIIGILLGAIGARALMSPWK